MDQLTNFFFFCFESIIGLTQIFGGPTPIFFRLKFQNVKIIIYTKRNFQNFFLGGGGGGGGECVYLCP